MPAARTPAQQQNALITYYLKIYNKRYGGAPPGWNRYRAKYAFADMCSDYGYDDAKRIIDYYFDLMYPGHPYQKLGSMYGDFYNSMIEDEEDRQKRIQIRKETEQRVREAQLADEARTTD